MTVKLIGHDGIHRCQLPQQSVFPNVFWWTANPLCKEGNIIQCEECDKQYKWTWYGYSGMWDWQQINVELPQVDGLPAPGARKND